MTPAGRNQDGLSVINSEVTLRRFDMKHVRRVLVRVINIQDKPRAPLLLLLLLPPVKGKMQGVYNMQRQKSCPRHKTIRFGPKTSVEQGLRCWKQYLYGCLIARSSGGLRGFTC